MVTSVYTVKLPETVSYPLAAAAIGDGLRAYTALHYQARLCAGETVLMLEGATSWGSLLIQLAHQWGAKVS